MILYQEVWASITKSKVYPQFAKRSWRHTLLYLFLFSSLTWLLGFVGIYQNVSQGIEEIQSKITNELPDFMFAQGVLKVNGPMPVILYKDLESIVVLDTSGNTDESILTPYHSGMLILADRMVNKRDQARTEEIQYTLFSGVSFSKETMVSWIPYLKWIQFPIALITFLYSFIAYLINALWVTLIGFLLNLFIKTKITFVEMYKMSVYALTLPLILDTLSPYVGIVLPGLIFYVVAGLYLALALSLWEQDEVVQV